MGEGSCTVAAIPTMRVAALVAAVAGAAVMPLSCSSRAGQEVSLVKIAVHHQGRRLPVPSDSATAVELGSLCLRQFETADSVLRLAVGKATIGDLRRHETAVELWFEPARDLTVGSTGRTLTVHSILIPVSGELAGEVTTLFYATGSAYASGPLRNSAGTSQLGELVRRFLDEEPEGERS